MKRYILFLWGVLGVFLSSYAQNVYTCRYWFDQNHSTSVVESFTDSVWHGNIDVASLTNGLHTLNLQVKDTSNRWNSPRSYMFVKVPDSIAREAVEYICWFDSDYSSRIAGNIGNGHILLDVAGLSEGEHTVNITLKDGDNYTSTRSYIFIKLPQNTMYENTDYICWFDSDYSSRITGNIGNGHILLDVAGLRDGVHTVNISLKHGDNYTSTRSYMFVKVPDSTVRENMEYYCWFDSDYSSRITGNIGNGHILLDVAGLRDGVHTVNISLKHGDNYTSTRSYMFVKVPDSTVRENMEYYCWFDSDYSTLQTGPLGNGHIQLDVDSLAEGMHTVTVMVKGSGFSPSFTYSFEVPNDSVFLDPTFHEYLVQFLNYDSTILQWDSVMYGTVPLYTGTTPQKPSTPQYSYIFRGWNPAVDTVRGNATYMAMYDSVLNHYLVRFENYDGSLLQQDSVAYGDSAFYRGVVPQRPAVAPCYYTFAGWQPEIGIVEQDTIFVAQYDSTLFAITCLSNDTAMGNASSSVPQYGVPTVTLTAVANTGYRFVSWNDGNTDNPRVITLSGDTVFTALFEEWDDVAIADTIVDVITACDSYTWINGVTYTESNNTATYRITVNNGGNEGVSDSIPGFEVSANIVTAVDKTTSNSIYNSLRSSSKSSSRDTIMVLNLTINYSTDTTIYDTICANSMYVENGFNTNVAGIYTDTLQTVNGCDSIVTLVLTVNSVSTGTDSITAYDSYTWIDGVTYTANNNTATYTLTNAAGCDSVVTLNLTINSSSSSIGIDSIIAFYSYTWIDGVTYTESTNTPTYHLYTIDGLDSIVILNLSIINIIDTMGDGGDIVITPDPDYIIGTLNYGDTILLSAQPESCYHFVNWSDGVTDNPRYIVVTGGITLSANYARNDALLGDTTVVACSSYTWINGETYTTSVVDTFALTTANGCDSLAVLNLTISNAVIYTDEVTACGSYTWIDGYTYTSSTNTPTYTITSESGCDSIINLHLTIKNNSYSVDTQIACDTYTWIDGNTYVQSTTTPTYTLTAANGCDSIVTLNLTINHSTTGVDVVSACDSYTWIDGVTYTASNNTATYTLTNAAGCDSVVTLNLTINNSSTTVDNVTACDSYTWIDGVTYTESTDSVTYTLTNAAGCDSIVTLNLTINHGTAGTDSVTACDSYTWIDGVTYTESTDSVTYTLTNAMGCDSVVTLILTINHSVYDTIVDTAMNEYTWNGTTYTESGVYEYAGETTEGCDSIVTLMLTITTVGIDVADEPELTFYPNPTSGTITFNHTDIRKVEVMDGMGRVVATFEDSYTIDLSNLSKGYYVLRITLPEGIAVRKVIRK